MNVKLLFLSLALACSFVMNVSAQVTDGGTTIPTEFATGHVNTTAPDAAPLDSRFGWDPGETFGQTFTLDSAIFLDSIYFAYNGFDDPGLSGDFTFTVDAGDDGSNEITQMVNMASADFSGNSATDTNDGPTYWARWDVSSENQLLGAGVHSFSMTLDTINGTPVSWLLAPLNQISGDGYSGGAATGILSADGRDAGFAVSGTAVSEPSAMVILTMIGLAGLTNRRRRK